MNECPLVRLSVATAVLCFSLFCSARAQLNDTFDPPLAGVTSTQAGNPPAASIQTGGPSNQFLRLVHDAVNSQNNRYSYDRTDVGAYDTVSARFHNRISSPGNQAADGYHYMLIPTAAFGTTGDGPTPTAEFPNWAGCFGIGFGVYPDVANDISLHWNGQALIDFRVPTEWVILDDQI